MDIKSTATYSSGLQAVMTKPATTSLNTAELKSLTTQQEVSMTKNNQENDETGANAEETNRLSKEDVEGMTESLNDFMQSLNTDIKFVLHQKMDMLMVQVVDNKSHKVLREAPPKELLDVMARVRDFVGALLDKKI